MTAHPRSQGRSLLRASGARVYARRVRERRMPCRLPHAQRGFSYAEALAAALLIALCLPAALEALNLATRSVAEQEAALARRFRLRGAMEQVLAETHAALDAAALAAGAPTVPSSYSDAAGTPDRRLVYLARYDLDDADGDANRLTGGDPGLIWVRVTIEGRPAALQTLTGP